MAWSTTIIEEHARGCVNGGVSTSKEMRWSPGEEAAASRLIRSTLRRQRVVDARAWAKCGEEVRVRAWWQGEVTRGACAAASGLADKMTAAEASAKRARSTSGTRSGYAHLDADAITEANWRGLYLARDRAEAQRAVAIARARSACESALQERRQANALDANHKAKLTRLETERKRVLQKSLALKEKQLESMHESWPTEEYAAGGLVEMLGPRMSACGSVRRTAQVKRDFLLINDKDQSNQFLVHAHFSEVAKSQQDEAEALTAAAVAAFDAAQRVGNTQGSSAAAAIAASRAAERIRAAADLVAARASTARARGINAAKHLHNVKRANRIRHDLNIYAKRHQAALRDAYAKKFRGQKRHEPDPSAEKAGQQVVQAAATAAYKATLAQKSNDTKAIPKNSNEQKQDKNKTRLKRKKSFRMPSLPVQEEVPLSEASFNDTTDKSPRANIPLPTQISSGNTGADTSKDQTIELEPSEIKFEEEENAASQSNFDCSDNDPLNCTKEAVQVDDNVQDTNPIETRASIEDSLLVTKSDNNKEVTSAAMVIEELTSAAMVIEDKESVKDNIEQTEEMQTEVIQDNTEVDSKVLEESTQNDMQPSAAGSMSKNATVLEDRFSKLERVEELDSPRMDFELKFENAPNPCHGIHQESVPEPDEACVQSKVASLYQDKPSESFQDDGIPQPQVSEDVDVKCFSLNNVTESRKVENLPESQKNKIVLDSNIFADSSSRDAVTESALSITEESTSSSSFSSVIRWVQCDHHQGSTTSQLNAASEQASKQYIDEYFAVDAVDETLRAAEHLLSNLDRDEEIDDDDDDKTLDSVLRRLDTLADNMRSRDLSFDPKIDLLQSLSNKTADLSEVSSFVSIDDDRLTSLRPLRTTEIREAHFGGNYTFGPPSTLLSSSIDSSVDELLRGFDSEDVQAVLEETDTTSDAADVLASLLGR